MRRARGGGKLWGYRVVEGGGKLGKSIVPPLLSLLAHGASLIVRNPILGSYPGITKAKEGRDTACVS